MTNIKMQYKKKLFYTSNVEVGEDLHLSIVSNEKGIVLLEFNLEDVELDNTIKKHFGCVEIITDAYQNKPYEKDIKDYFQGKIKNFTVPLDLLGTDFQKKVWRALMEIPYGTTVSYKEVASRIGNPKAMRAVGMANNKNKVPIIIPCHRVIGADGSLIGYGGGLSIKEKLLQLEGIEIKKGKVVK